VQNDRDGHWYRYDAELKNADGSVRIIDPPGADKDPNIGHFLARDGEGPIKLNVSWTLSTAGAVTGSNKDPFFYVEKEGEYLIKQDGTRQSFLDKILPPIMIEIDKRRQP